MARVETLPKALPPWRLLPVNFLGCAAFLVSLAVMAVIRYFIPDEVMMRPTQPWSSTANSVAVVYILVWLACVWTYFRVSDSFWLTVFGAAWSALGVVPLFVEFATDRQISMLPALAGFSLFSLFVAAHAVWLRALGANENP